MNAAYGMAYNLARHTFMETPPESMSIRSGCAYQSDTGEFFVEYINKRYKVSHRNGVVLEVTASNSEAPVEISIIILHYLLNSTGIPLSSKWVSFRDIPGGSIYYTAFEKRILKHMIRAFSPAPSKLLQSAQALGGKPLEIAGTRSIGVLIYVLPRVPVGLILWPGDDEMPTSGNIMYDSSIGGYLPTEDVVVATGHVLCMLTC